VFLIYTPLQVLSLNNYRVLEVKYLVYMGIIYSGRLRLTYPILIGVCEGDFVREIRMDEVGKLS
jgi:hypothetical protein